MSCFSMYTSAFTGLAACVSFAAFPAFAQDPGLYITLTDNVGVEVNGQGSFADEQVVLIQDGVPSPFFAINSGDLDAFHILDNGNYLLSSLFNGNVGGNTFSDGDLVEYDPISNTIVGNYLDLGEDSFINSNGDISAATTDADGNLYFASQTSTNTITHAGGTLSFTNGDVVQIDAVTGVASIFLAEADLFDDGDGTVFGLHWLGNGELLISHNTNDDTAETISGNAFLDGDVFTYDFLTGESALFFSESSFTDDGFNSYDINGVYFVVPAPGAAAVLAAGGIVAARRRRA